MSTNPFRSSAGDLGYRGRGGERWDTERFAIEHDRNRFGGEERERFEERDTRFSRGGGFGRARERSVDEVFERERRGPRGYEDDRFERRAYYDEEPRFEREKPFGRESRQTVTFEKERVYSPSPPRRAPARPAFLRRQSSLDTFDRKPLTRYVEREEYGPPARYREEIRPPPLTPIPLPRTRALPPPRRYAEREYYDEIKVAEPDYYGDEEFRAYPERVREREVIRRRRRSRSRESRASQSVRSSVRSSSRGSSSSSTSFETVKSEFPKRGKTRMPARLVSKQVIIDLGYPFEEEGETIIIMKALGRENIDEVIKLSEDYKKVEKVEMSGGRSEAGTVVEERRTEVFTVPPIAYLPAPPPSPPVQNLEVVQDTRIVETHHRSHSPAMSHRSHHHHHSNPIILDAGPREESTFVERKREIIERSDPIPVGPLALALPAERSRVKDERTIRAEIKALEAEKEAFKAERRADREMRKADRIRRGGRSSETDLVIYDRERFEGPDEEVTLVRRERIVEPEGGVRIEKDKKGPPPKLGLDPVSRPALVTSLATLSPKFHSGNPLTEEEPCDNADSRIFNHSKFETTPRKRADTPAPWVITEWSSEDANELAIFNVLWYDLKTPVLTETTWGNWATCYNLGHPYINTVGSIDMSKTASASCWVFPKLNCEGTNQKVPAKTGITVFNGGVGSFICDSPASQ
ncbi:hypothetical protein G7Y89_g3199 [Cudoniella acicularis]|uniref:DUF8035 domain-containing protein n=1 Tax=Cudoniella acicularis TaxID=354080 RepID=A0A8H4RTT2_9HELO|nr:hypothetical protein G7Y89_g3199 [Cudoniella acicularis]